MSDAADRPPKTNAHRRPVNLLHFGAILLLYALFLDASQSGGFDVDRNMPLAGILVLLLLDWTTLLIHYFQIDLILVVLPLLLALKRRADWTSLGYLVAFLLVLNLVNSRNYERYRRFEPWRFSSPGPGRYEAAEHQKARSYPQYVLHASRLFLKQFYKIGDNREPVALFDYLLSLKILLVAAAGLAVGIGAARKPRSPAKTALPG